MLNAHHPSALTSRATLAVALLFTTMATPVNDSLLRGLAWRNIGPFRGGRVSAASGAIGETGTFYVGLPAGGVWKTTSAGETWFPVFDSITSSSSVGAVAVAPSNPNVVYVGMGDQYVGLQELNEGDGVYRSGDGGKTWHHMGLADSKRIPSIIVDPHDENVLLVAALGPLFKKDEMRGVFRSCRRWDDLDQDAVGERFDRGLQSRDRVRSPAGRLCGDHGLLRATSPPQRCRLRKAARTARHQPAAASTSPTMVA